MSTHCDDEQRLKDPTQQQPAPDPFKPAPDPLQTIPPPTTSVVRARANAREQPVVDEEQCREHVARVVFEAFGVWVSN